MTIAPGKQERELVVPLSPEQSTLLSCPPSTQYGELTSQGSYGIAVTGQRRVAPRLPVVSGHMGHLCESSWVPQHVVSEIFASFLRGLTQASFLRFCRSFFQLSHTVLPLRKGLAEVEDVRLIGEACELRAP